MCCHFHNAKHASCRLEHSCSRQDQDRKSVRLYLRTGSSYLYFTVIIMTFKHGLQALSGTGHKVQLQTWRDQLTSSSPAFPAAAAVSCSEATSPAAPLSTSMAVFLFGSVSALGTAAWVPPFALPGNKQGPHQMCAYHHGLLISYLFGIYFIINLCTS